MMKRIYLATFLMACLFWGCGKKLSGVYMWESDVSYGVQSKLTYDFRSDGSLIYEVKLKPRDGSYQSAVGAQHGTYKVQGSKVTCTIEGEPADNHIFSIEGDDLVLVRNEHRFKHQ